MPTVSGRLSREVGPNGTYSSYCNSVGFFDTVADERFVHTDPVHDSVGGFCKMVFDIIEKSFVAIAGLHEVFSGIYFVEHDFGSTAKSCASTRLGMSVDRIVMLSPY